MSKGKIAREVAEEEVKSWLEFRKVKKKKLDENKDDIDVIIDAIVDGVITIENNVINQKLTYPLGKEGDSESIAVLSFKPRLKVSTVRVCTQGIKSNDNVGIAGGYIAAATGVDRNLINSMDMEDFSVSQSIVIFFL